MNISTKKQEKIHNLINTFNLRKYGNTSEGLLNQIIDLFLNEWNNSVNLLNSKRFRLKLTHYGDLILQTTSSGQTIDQSCLNELNEIFRLKTEIESIIGTK